MRLAFGGGIFCSAILAQRLHRTARSFQVALLGGSRVTFAICSQSIACRRNSSDACIGLLSTLSDCTRSHRQHILLLCAVKLVPILFLDHTEIVALDIMGGIKWRTTSAINTFFPQRIARSLAIGKGQNASAGGSGHGAGAGLGACCAAGGIQRACWRPRRFRTIHDAPKDLPTRL